jgi:multidrug transporter EmrE-like cation transporter
MRAIAMVACCTVLGSAAQVLMKTGTHSVQPSNLLQVFTNVPLLGGYALYAMSTLLLVIALRYGELSILYPVISLTYVWVSILSVLIFNERMGLLKICGLTLIVAGVGILGIGGKKE